MNYSSLPQFEGDSEPPLTPRTDSRDCHSFEFAGLAILVALLIGLAALAAFVWMLFAVGIPVPQLA